MKNFVQWLRNRDPVAFCIGAIYLLIAAAWIQHGDRILQFFIADLSVLAQLQAYKNWIAIGITTMLLYTISRRRVPDRLQIKTVEDDRRVKWLIISFLLLFVIAVLVNLVFAIRNARQDTLSEMENATQKLTQVLEEQTGGNINAVEITMKVITKTIQLLPKYRTDRNTVIHNLLTDSIRNLPFVRAIWILDAAGNMIHDSESLPGKYNLSDREYFQVHRASPDRGLFIDRPLLSKHGVWFIGVSRRIDNIDGSFGGVIVAALEPKYLQRFYESITVGKQGVVALVRADGILMLRAPAVEHYKGAQLFPLPKFMEMLPHFPSGSYREKSRVDGVKRIFYRAIPKRPLVVVVGLGEAESLTAWRSTAQAYVAASLAFLFVIGVLGYFVLAELRRRAVLNSALAESEAALTAAQALSRLGSWHMDLASGRTRWSEQMFRLFNLKPANEPPAQKDFLQMLHPDDRSVVESAEARMIETGNAWSGELRSNPDHGPIRYYDYQGTAVRDTDGNVVALEGTLQDITERHRSEEKLRHAARVFEHTSDGITIADTNLKIVAVNSSFERITGYAEPEVIGKHPRLLHAGRNDPSFDHDLWTELRIQGHWRGEVWSRRKNGELYPVWLSISAITDEKGRRTGYVGVFSDLSEIREANEQLNFLLQHDPLTRLPNRALLTDRLQQTIDAAMPFERQVAVLMLNIDRLQLVNDSIGHDAGDMLLKEMAGRLSSLLAPGDTLARPGSDEFVMISTHTDDMDDVMSIAQRMLEEVSAPCLLYGHALTVTASIGISIYPNDGTNPSDLLKRADAALSHAKSEGRNGFRFFTEAMNARALHWISLEHRLRNAIRRDELVLYYQPKLCLSNGQICGVEALIRWKNPDLGLIGPAEFIPLAEDTGLIVEIGEWAIHRACMQAKEWQRMGLPPLAVAVNVSTHQITAGTLLPIVKTALAELELESHLLEIELTESVLMRQTEAALAQISELRKIGVSVSLDDFGTGYSSLSYLSRFPFNKLKIDQSFVRDIIVDRKNAAITQATVSLAHGLGMTVIAEGVEAEQQLIHLRNAGCDEIQGFLVSRPIPADTLQTYFPSITANGGATTIGM